jgi:hypothetical protein
VGTFEVIERRDVGEFVHVFSHIRQTMLVEKLVVSGVESTERVDEKVGVSGLESLDSEAGEGRGVKRRIGEEADELEGGVNGGESEVTVRLVRWVPAEEMTSVGLTSGVRKVSTPDGFHRVRFWTLVNGLS